MSRLISQVLEGFIRLLLKRTVLVLTIMFCIAVGVALSSTFNLSMKLIETQALQNAAWSAKSINEAIALYSDEAVTRAQTVDGITVTHNYPTQKGAIPLPSTYALELGWRISARNEGMSIRLYSDYPFPWRKADGGAKDEFEQEALQYLRQQPSGQFSKLEKKNGQVSLRYAQASLMQSSCVACHNTHPDSPKRDWQVGDVRGVWEVTQPLDKFVEQTQAGMRGTFVMLGGISVLGLSGLTLVISRLRQTAKELEQRVRERTADLAQANTDLGKRNDLIRQVFGRYISDRIVAQLLESPEALKLGGERRKITILTSDLRGFTSLSERLQPEEVIDILNLYLKYMADVITKYEGTIDEFMGDGILVLFGAPTVKEDDAIRAVACACAMQLAMGAVNEKMKELGLPPLEMGIGINTGEVVVGNIGSEKRTKYGIVGSQVNLTYRIESYTTGGQILISEATLNDVESIVRIGGQKQVKPKGVKEPITIYEIIGIGGFYNLYLPPKEEEVFLSVVEEIPLQYTILEGKQVGDTVFKGRLVKLSAKGAEIHSETEGDVVPSELSNIKFNLLTPNNPTEISEDVYGKVLEKPADGGNFYIHFTATPPAVKERLNVFYLSAVKASS